MEEYINNLLLLPYGLIIKVMTVNFIITLG